MKRLLLLAFLSLSLAATDAFAQLPANDLEGTWVLISQKVVYPDSTVDRGRTLPRTIKVLNSTHFMFGRQMSGSEEVYAGGGRYSYDGKTYTEHIEFHSGAGLAGESIPFDVRLDGDLWYHTSKVPAFSIEEIWRRVQPGEGAAAPAQ